MAKKTTNVGLVRAIFVSNNAPTNTNILWFDTTENLHKAYNASTSAWEPLVEMVLIDNDTIKKDVDGKLYVDETALAGYVLGNGSVTLIKMANVGSGTVFYRKSAGDGPPEVQTLAQLRSDLNIPDAPNLSLYALKSYKINNKVLNGDITLTPSDIGSPSGSGECSNTNTGDETAESIKDLLGITVLSGDNTGDQNALAVPITDTAEYFLATNVEDALIELYLIASYAKQKADLAMVRKKITLPAYASVSVRCSNAVEIDDYPEGWVLTTGESEYDLKVTHNLNRNWIGVEIWEVNGDGTERCLPGYSSAYTGKLQLSKNEIMIQGLTQDELPLRIELIFE